MTDLTSHWRNLYDNKYMGAWNLWIAKSNRYGNVTVTIESVTFETIVMQGGRKNRALLMRFKGKRTPMIITKTMGKTLEKLHGPTPSQWVGKEITIYVEQGFKTKDGPADVLRIRNTRAGDGLKSQLRGEVDEAAPEPERFASDDGEPREPGMDG